MTEEQRGAGGDTAVQATYQAPAALLLLFASAPSGAP